MSKITCAILLTAAAAMTASGSFADTESWKSVAPGKADLQSIGALEIGPDGVLFAGDSQGSAVYAIDVAHPSTSLGEFEGIEDLDGKIAALLGTDVRGVHVKDMAVHEESGAIYLSVMRGDGDDAKPVLVRVQSGGKIEDVPLDNVRFSKLEIPDAPSPGARLYRWQSRSFTITDLEFIGGELYIAGLSNEEFASKLRRAPYPFEGELRVTDLEIYHGAHGEFETMAPIFSFVPYELDGREHLLAGYLCTPLVTFPLDDVKKEGKLRGKTIAELGWGNIPSDLVPYEKEGEGYLLVVNNTRGNMRMKKADIAAAQKGEGITTRVGPRTGVEDETVPLGNVAQAAAYGAGHVAVLGRSMENGSLYLQVVSNHRL